MGTIFILALGGGLVYLGAHIIGTDFQFTQYWTMHLPVVFTGNPGAAMSLSAARDIAVTMTALQLVLFVIPYKKLLARSDGEFEIGGTEITVVGLMLLSLASLLLNFSADYLEVALGQIPPEQALSSLGTLSTRLESAGDVGFILRAGKIGLAAIIALGGEIVGGVGLILIGKALGVGARVKLALEGARSS